MYKLVLSREINVEQSWEWWCRETSDTCDWIHLNIQKPPLGNLVCSSGFIYLCWSCSSASFYREPLLARFCGHSPSRSLTNRQGERVQSWSFGYYPTFANVLTSSILLHSIQLGSLTTIDATPFQVYHHYIWPRKCRRNRSVTPLPFLFGSTGDLISIFLNRCCRRKTFLFWARVSSGSSQSTEEGGWRFEERHRSCWRCCKCASSEFVSSKDDWRCAPNWQAEVFSLMEYDHKSIKEVFDQVKSHWPDGRVKTAVWNTGQWVNISFRIASGLGNTTDHIP